MHTASITYKIDDLGLLPIGLPVGRLAGFIADKTGGEQMAETIGLDYRPKPYFRPRKLESYLLCQVKGAGGQVSLWFMSHAAWSSPLSRRQIVP
jgi:hypothetical protein